MIHRVIKIGRWVVDFLFAIDRYDADGILGCLYDCGASDFALRQAADLIYVCDYNCGFTFANPENYRACVVIGPTTSGEEFQDTFTHEIRHLADAIAKNLGLRLDSEGPAYITGDTVRELAEVVCELGCSKCRGPVEER